MTISNEITNASVESTSPEAVGATGADALPASTPEYAPAAQVFVENVAEQGTGNKERGTEEKDVSDPIKSPAAPPTASADASLPQQAYDLMVQFVSRDPRFELNNNVRQVLAEVQHLRMAATDTPAVNDDLAAIRETVQHIWTHLQNEGARNRSASERPEQGTEGAATATVAGLPTAELVNETRTLVRSVNEEVNATRNNTIQMTNQMRIAMDVTTRCLREMDKTARKYEQQIERQAEQPAAGQNGEHGEIMSLLDELRSLRDMLADGFENARLEPIAPEPGEAFRYNEHRADNGFTAGGKIKRTLFAGFRWTQPTPPVVLLPAIVETE